MEIKPDDPAEGEKARLRYEALLALYPRDLACEMVKAWLDAQPPYDNAMPPDISAEELERMFFEATTPEQRIDLEKQMRGESIDGFNVDIDKLAEEQFSRDVETAIRNVLNAWKQMLHVARMQQGGADVFLTDTLEPVVPIRFGKTPEITWKEAPCNSIMLTPEQVGKLHEAFAAKLRPLIDVAPKGYVLWSEEFIIKKYTQGYFLLVSPAP